MILIDTPNLFYCVKRKYGGLLDYRSFFHWIESTHGSQQKVAYVSDHDGTSKFIEMFRNIPRCDVFLKKPYKRGSEYVTDFSVDITIDALTQDYEKLILCSSDYRLLSLVEYLKDNDVETHVYAAGIPLGFGACSTVHEIEGRNVKNDG